MRGRVVMGSGIAAWLLAAGASPGATQTTTEVPAEPSWLDVEVTELFRVGTLGGAAHEEFGSVDDVAFGPDGSLHVLDSRGFRVVVFDPSGAFRHEFGGEGGGPAEFQYPIALDVDAEGRVWVADLLGQSLDLFDAAGALVANARMADSRPALPTLTASDGGAFVLDRMANATNESIPLYRVGEDGSVEVAARLPIPFTPRQEQTSAMTFRRVGPPTFAPETRAVALPGGRWAATHGTVYEVSVAGSEGPSLLVRAPLTPAPVTAAHEEEHKERMRERNRELAENPPPAIGGFAMRAADEEQMESALREMRFAEEHPAIRRLLADRDGRLWIQRWDGSPWGPAPIDLVAAYGSYLGTLRALEMPDAVGPDGRVAWIEEDEMGVPAVRVARLELPGR